MTNAKVRKALNLDNCSDPFLVAALKRKHVRKPRSNRWN